jgi:hypothetical protein
MACPSDGKLVCCMYVCMYVCKHVVYATCKEEGRDRAVRWRTFVMYNYMYTHMRYMLIHVNESEYPPCILTYIHICIHRIKPGTALPSPLIGTAGTFVHLEIFRVSSESQCMPYMYVHVCVRVCVLCQVLLSIWKFSG